MFFLFGFDERLLIVYYISGVLAMSSFSGF